MEDLSRLPSYHPEDSVRIVLPGEVATGGGTPPARAAPVLACAQQAVRSPSDGNIALLGARTPVKATLSLSPESGREQRPVERTQSTSVNKSRDAGAQIKRTKTQMDKKKEPEKKPDKKPDKDKKKK